MNVTDEDRAKAEQLYLACRSVAAHRQKATGMIAAALAEERGRAEEPMKRFIDDVRAWAARHVAEAKQGWPEYVSRMREAEESA